MKSIEEREVFPTQSPRSKESTPSQQSTQAKNGQNQNDTSVTTFKLAQAMENPWIQFMYKNHKTNS